MKAVQQLLFDVDWRAGTGGSDLDVLVVDTPPGTGDVTLSLGQLVTVDGALLSGLASSRPRPSQGDALADEVCLSLQAP